MKTIREQTVLQIFLSIAFYEYQTSPQLIPRRISELFFSKNCEQIERLNLSSKIWIINEIGS